jgi:hypothetical protein
MRHGRAPRGAKKAARRRRFGVLTFQTYPRALLNRAFAHKHLRLLTRIHEFCMWPVCIREGNRCSLRPIKGLRSGPRFARPWPADAPVVGRRGGRLPEPALRPSRMSCWGLFPKILQCDLDAVVIHLLEVGLILEVGLKLFAALRAARVLTGRPPVRDFSSWIACRTHRDSL